METLKIAEGIIIVAFTGLLAGTILFWIWQGKIPLYKLLSESNGDASLSRLQLLIFTFVIALSLFMIIAHDNKFPPIPNEVLMLLGISGSSYLVSKAIQFSDPAGIARPALVISPGSLVLTSGDPNPVFTASVVNAPADTPMPSLTWTLDAPAWGAINIKPPNQVEYTPPMPMPPPPPGTKIIIRAKAPGFEDGRTIVTIA